MNHPDIPIFEKGQELTAAQLNKLARAIRPLLVPGSFSDGQMTLQRPMNRGGGTTNLTAFAIVTEEAGASSRDDAGSTFVLSGGTIGKALLLEDDEGGMNVPDANGSEIEFKSFHRVACAVGTTVILHSTKTIQPGSTFAKSPVWGTLTEGTDYLQELSGAGIEKSLVGGASATDIKWAGTTCPAP